MKFLQKPNFAVWSNWLRGLWLKGLPRSKPRLKKVLPRPLVASRPASLEQRYLLVDERGLADEVFFRLERDLFGALERSRGPTLVREAGRLAPGRPYFYIKPLNQKGLLFERSGAGWLVTPAEKIVAQQLFLRETDPVDQVNLYVAPGGQAYPRVQARAQGEDLLAFAVYEDRLLKQLGLQA